MSSRKSSIIYFSYFRHTAPAHILRAGTSRRKEEKRIIVRKLKKINQLSFCHRAVPHSPHHHFPPKRRKKTDIVTIPKKNKILSRHKKGCLKKQPFSDFIDSNYSAAGL